MPEAPLSVGVVGVGSMGQHHARTYREVEDAELVGVADADEARATEVAADLGTDAHAVPDLLEQVDAVSVAVPTHAHDAVASACIDAGVDALVEKPFVADPERGRELAAAASDAGVTLQVGHVERFNPVVDAVFDAVEGRELVSVRADRLGPPAGRVIPDSVVFDLMIHDVDVVLELAGERPANVDATATADGEYAVATLEFDSGLVATLSASRVSHDSVRELAVNAEGCGVTADYAAQSVSVTRDDGGAPDDVTEADPLTRELRSFVDAAATGASPVVSADDALRAIDVVREIEAAADLADATPPSEETAVDGA
ncbi:Gfo/Idh/MocA family protein [Halobacterium litoreum]|uniref:Gfo/Idh/MocA family oxidoreductase n=1 Tax=Halobacterium litoreum TaxID=2039234 RepID=A0ABD5NBR2_9EURY|nr:Gfo/Idh/MocA family oxidoreductase [Halobacterium litoreum]UHH14407.1 Gfo/Idh/MocA family oxidoreductase [Halobacterium litoreum]